MPAHFKLVKLLLVAVLVLTNTVIIGAPTHNGGIEISSLRVDLSADQATENLTITNLDNQPTLFQTSVKKWSQVDGKDIYQDTNDLIITPMIFKAEPHQKQVIRIGLMKPIFTNNEQTYRLYITQLRDANKNKKAISLLFGFGVPVFVKPLTPKTGEVKWLKTKGQLSVKNDTNMHIKLTKLQLVNPSNKKILFDKSIFVYVLPHQTYHFLDVSKNLLSTKSLLIKFKIDNDEEEFSLNG